MDQLSLFGPEEPRRPRKAKRGPTAREARKEAVARVERNADPGWMAEAWETLIRVAARRETFTTGDLWAAGLPNTHENRALGPLFLRAAKLKYIENTHITQKSTRVCAHERPMTVWRSRIFVRGK